LPKGKSGKSLLAFVGHIPEPDIIEMEVAINENCGKVEQNEW
jgi:hypothetical protein